MSCVTSIIAVNQTAGAIYLEQLSVTVPGSGQVELVDYAIPDEILADVELRTEICAGNITLNVNSRALTLEQSIEFVNPVNEITVKHWFFGTTAPTVNEDEVDGYSIGSRWFDQVDNKEYICLDDTAGAAEWKSTILDESDIHHGNIIGLDQDDHPQYLRVDGYRSMEGDLDMDGYDIINVNLINGVDITDHASRHERTGADPIDGDHLDIDFTPTNYTPSTTPPEASHVDDLAAHLAGIDNALASVGVSDHGNLTGLLDDDHPQYLLVDGSRPMNGDLDMDGYDIIDVNLINGIDITAHAPRHISGGADEIDGDKLDIDFTPTNYTPTISPSEADGYDELTAHLAGIDDALQYVSNFYGALADDPTPPPSPSSGDQYYNTDIDEFMIYDEDRSKWLSANSLEIQAGKTGSTAVGSYYRGPGDMTLDNSNRGIPVPKGTIVSIAWSRTDAVAATLEVLVNGAAVTELASSAAGATRDDTKNVDFAAGLMSFRNKSTGNTTENVQILVSIKKRD